MESVPGGIESYSPFANDVIWFTSPPGRVLGMAATDSTPRTANGLHGCGVPMPTGLSEAAGTLRGEKVLMLARTKNRRYAIAPRGG